MRKQLILTALAATLPLAGIVHAEEESSPFSANVSIVSDYDSRGVSQTNESPAIQGGFDFTHSSGVYAGIWASSISWLRDAERHTDASSGNSAEVDFTVGYAREFGDFGVDVGAVYYLYPGSYSHNWKDVTGLKNPNSTEGFVGLSWKFVSVKYYHAFTNLFGAPSSRGSGYLDLSVSYEILKDLSLEAHFGSQRVTGPGESYHDWKAGAVYNLGGYDLGLHYVNTDISHADKVDADARLVFSLSKSF